MHTAWVKEDTSEDATSLGEGSYGGGEAQSTWNIQLHGSPPPEPAEQVDYIILRSEYEADLEKMKEALHESDQKLANLEKIVAELKKPGCGLKIEVVVGVCLTVLVLLIGIVMFSL